MRLIRAALLAASAVTLPLAAAAQEKPAPAAPMKPIAFTTRTLANGLRVYAIRDTGTPNVAVQVWYDVGGKDDPRGRSGFAHLFEHLMFKATRNLVPEQMDRLTEDVGGYNNASTGDDYTNYYEVVPANHLQRLLFAEADRMGSLAVEQSTFVSERDVVKEEYRQSVLSRPYGKLFGTYLPAITYRTHPYARGVIGDIANLDSATIDDVRAFHATYYRPDNAILVVSGNFDPAQLDKWIDQYFAGIKKPAGALPRVTVDEPVRAKPASYTVYEPNTPLPAVAITWPLPPDRDADAPALMVLNAILSTGESSRFYENLVYKEGIAQSAETQLDMRQGPGSLVAYAIVAGGKDVGAAEASLRRQIAAVRETPVSAAELAEAKNEILTGALKGLETAEGKARMIASSVLIDGDPTASERQLAQVQTVTAADVQRVARKYLGDARAASIRYLPAEGKPANAKGDDVAIAASVVTAPLTPPADIAVVTPASAADRVAPPAPATPVATAVPTPSETRLANGLRVITVERHGVPLVTAELVALGGEGDAMPAGTASLTADLLTKGTTTRSATQIARAAEMLGASLSSDAGRDGSSLGITVRSSALAPALGIMADVAQHPAFAADEIERARGQAIDAATLSFKDPADLARMTANRAVYGSGAYATAEDGTPKSLKAIARGQVAASYAAAWRPDRVALVVAGDVTPAEARRLAEASFGSWKANGAAPAATAKLAAAPAPRVVVVDMPDAGQAGVVVARPGIARRDADFYPASVANTVLGGGFSSRLNYEVRIKRGLAYGAGSALDTRREGGSVIAFTQTKNPSAAEVVTLITAEMAKLGKPPAPTDAELATRKAVLVGNFGRNIERTEGLAAIVGGYVTNGVPLDKIGRYTRSIEAVPGARVEAVAAKLLDPSKASIVVVGDAKQFVGDLRKSYPALEVIPAASLDLDSATLK
ncbi:Peptidase M16 [Sphingomonas sp. EC-HK361]|uniref:M16 family metallopeptidase n=1 Tax=Sphingomonas sp. EC-HK361 TaxID=2038397 RepID=UPI001250EB50|nr:pitrilysin family protein [Sphingomonas sp. EC-HK361]VVS97398.1 Peptidase M16 [Sphingomonas sp. EC-HK361]